ncbi:transcription repressor OFP14 [Vitis vinifera]|uniref:Transcription repressor n=3 Tax=Vitis vinifera TaxID=29760 RepID=A0A3Q8WHY0_VITVI
MLLSTSFLAIKPPLLRCFQKTLSRQTSRREKMPRKIQKSLQDYLSKLKKPTPHIQLSANNALSASINRMLLGCKYPKTLIDVDRDQTNSRGSDHGHAATLSDIDRFLFENFRSLYQKNDDDDDDDDDTKKREEEEEEEEEEKPGGVLFESPRIMDPTSNICSCHRFFTTPCSSSSLMEDARASLAVSSEGIASSYATSSTSTVDCSSSSSNDIKEVLAPHDCIAVLTNSPNPYVDFRLSMQEMIEARLHSHEKVDWDFMEDLLFCYLNLNDKDSHKYILQAFVDLICVLRQKTDKVSMNARGEGEWRRE